MTSMGTLTIANCINLGFALYRALLRRCQKTLSLEHADLFRQHTKNLFRSGAKARSHSAIRRALNAGYKASCKIYESSQASDCHRQTLNNLATNKSDVLRQLEDLSINSSGNQQLEGKIKQKTPPGTSGDESHQSRRTSSNSGRRWPHPDAKPVLDGLPAPPPGKLRRVPTLVNANHIPIIRFKKPQSPFLSYIIRTRTEQREKRVGRIHELEKALDIAMDEDQWDATLLQNVGFRPNDGGTMWVSAVKRGLTNVKQVHQRNITKRSRTAQRMFDIVEEQRELAEQEKLDRRERRYLAYKARKAQREAASAAEEDPDNEGDTPAASVAGT